MRKIRLTGGEPLLRKNIERLIEQVENAVEARTNVRLLREVRIIGERI